MENGKTNLASNLFYQIGYRLVLILSQLITVPYISRVLKPEGLGIYSYSSSIVAIFMLAANLGISYYGNREIAATNGDKAKLSKTFWGIYWAHLFCTLVASIGYFIFVIYIDSADYVVAICQGVQLLSALFDITWLFTGLQNFRVTFIRNLLVRISSVVFIFIFVNDPGDIYLYILVLGITSLVGQVSMFSQIFRYVGRPVFCRLDIINGIKHMCILFIPEIAMSIYRYMDKIMLEKMCTLEQLGYYECAQKIVEIPVGVLVAVGSVMLPRTSNMLARGETDATNKLLGTTIKYVMLMAILFSCGLIGVAPVFTPMFFGNDYTECSSLLACISISIIFMAWANCLRTQYLIPKKKDKEFTIAVFLGAGVNLIVNLLLITKIGAMGAVVGTICAEATVAVAQTWFVRKEIDSTKLMGASLFFLIPGIIMIIFIRSVESIVGNPVPTLIIQVLGGSLIYFGISGLYLYLTKDEFFVTNLALFKKRIKLKR